MILFHYTRAKFVPSIMEHGLIPRATPRTVDCRDPAAQAEVAARRSNNIPVVWLTCEGDEWAGTRLRVRLEANNKRLQLWLPWARTFSPDIDDVCTMARLQSAGPHVYQPELHYVYLGTIPPHLIEVDPEWREAA